MAENIKVTKYPDGTNIPIVTDSTAWMSLDDYDTTDAYCYYNNNVSGEADTYGALYTWAGAMGDNAVSSSNNPSGVQGICPNGWHLPSDDEWKELEMELGMSQSEADQSEIRGTNEGSKLASNSSLWNNGILENNAEFGSSGFSALPSGCRWDNGSFFGKENNAYFWSATEASSTHAWSRLLTYYEAGVWRYDTYKSYGFSVRCLKDN